MFVECLECGKIVKSIGFKHLQICCGLLPIEYKKKHNVTSLTDQDVRDKCNPIGKRKRKERALECIRICTCGRTVIHRGKGCELVAKSSVSCKDCAKRTHWVGKHHTKETREKISKANKGKDYNKSRIGIKESEETLKRKSESLRNRKGGFEGKLHTKETREKLRVSRLKDIDSKYPYGWTAPNYNKRACCLFREINSTLGWNGVHAENVGEFRVSGYLVDYYEPNQNVVIEFDESYHNSKNQKIRDKLRQDRIVELLKCRFFRIKDGEEATWKNIIRV